MSIIVENASFKRELVADEDGNYEIELPLGTYTLNATKEGYRPPKTKRFCMRADVVKTLDIIFPPIYTNADPNPIRTSQLMTPQ